jgi:hypothetical protein
MNNAVMNPQAMNAAMFGMIIPDKNVPNFCTATRAPDVLLVLLAPTSALAAMYTSVPSGLHAHDVHRTALRRDKSPAAPLVGLPALPGPRQAQSPRPPPTSPSRPFSFPWSGSHRSTNNDIAQVRPSARLLTNSDMR